MTTASAPVSRTVQPTLLTNLPLSERGFANCTEALNRVAEINSTTQLIPAEIIERYIAQAEGLMKPIGMKIANEMVDVLITQNPTTAAADIQVYRNTLLAILAHYPKDYVKLALDPVNGVMAKTQHQLRPAELKAFLDHKIEALRTGHFKACKMRDEHRRRGATVEQQHKTPEERRAFVQRVLKGAT